MQKKTTFYGEYNSKGNGANISKRVFWSHQLTKEESKKYTAKNILSGKGQLEFQKIKQVKNFQTNRLSKIKRNVSTNKIKSVQIFLTGAVLTSASSFGQEKTIQKIRKNPKAPFSYAELSVKEGGKWQNNEYIGGTFKNVNQLTIPAEHTDHSYYIRYEGIGLENNQIGYRLYLDWRNATDIFGKKVNTLVLPEVGQDGFESYHNDASWGQDILKSGRTIGIGSYGRYDEQNDFVETFKTVKKHHCKSGKRNR